jgi:hypothetical protein
VDVVVRVALDRLEVELACDLHTRLDPEAVHLDDRELPADLAQSAREVRARQVPGQRSPGASVWSIAKHSVEELDAFLDDGVRLPRDDFVGPYLVLEILD